MLFHSLLFAVALTVATATPAGDGAQSVAFVERYCLTKESVAEKRALLISEGWHEPVKDLLQKTEVPNLRVFMHSKHPQIITINSPKLNLNEVQACVVDGKNVDARQVIETAVARWGAPTGPGVASWLPSSEFAGAVTLIESKVLKRDPKVPAVALAVIFDPEQNSKKDK